jgi:predicted Zn-dependent peptidase
MNAKTKLVTAAGAAAVLAGALALAEDVPTSAPAAKPPHRKWQDVPQPALDKLPETKLITATLKNGIKVFLIEDHELPTIDVTLLVRAGEWDLLAKDLGAQAKAGLASITGEVMRSGGTEKKTGDELDEELDAIASSVSTSVGLDQAHARMSCLKEHLDATLATFADVVRHPAFREDRIVLAKRQAMGRLRRRNDNPAQIASREFAKLIYTDASPLGWRDEPATIESITRDDVVRFYREAFAANPAGALLGAVGDFDAAKMKEKLEAVLGDWSPEKAEGHPVQGHTDGFQGPGPKVYFVKKTDVNQSTVILGHPGIQRKPGDPDYPAAVVANFILGGGGFAGRLMQHVRTEMGLAYGCRSSLDAAMGHQGTFVMQGQTKCGSTLAMTRAMRKELERLVSEKPTAEELRVAKKSILEGLVFSYDRKSAILDRALRNEFYGFPQNELEVFAQGVSEVSADDCLRVAKKLLDPARLTTLVVGNDAEFDGKLEELGPVTALDVKVPERRGRRGEGAGER